jgi:tRNA-2-methylthio-N6-dimethylallyladenosine synthase
MREFRAGLDAGYKTFHLIADDVGCWGQDIGSDSAQLLKEMLSVDADFQIAIYYFDPTWLMKLYPKLREPMADPRIIFVNFPIQSGSSELVQKMDRHYTVEGALSRIAAIKASNPNMVLKTHLMVGYPEETDEDYRRSLWAIQFFDVILANAYGPRPHTKAAEMPDQVPARVKRYRFLRMKAVIMLRHAEVFFRSFLNPQRPPAATTAARASAQAAFRANVAAARET